MRLCWSSLALLVSFGTSKPTSTTRSIPRRAETPPSIGVQSIQNQGDTGKDIYGLGVAAGEATQALQCDKHDRSAFTQYAVGLLNALNPTKNGVVIFWDLDYDGVVDSNASYLHYEVPLCDTSTGYTRGFDLWMFDYGWIENHGDGGWINWGVEGNFVGSGNGGKHVDFYARDGSAPIPTNADGSVSEPAKEIYYLIDIEDSSGSKLDSGFAHYNDIATSWAGNQPDDYTSVQYPSTFVSWESSFDSDGTNSAEVWPEDHMYLTAEIGPCGGNTPKNQLCGRATTKYRPYNCYKDDGRTLYTTNDGSSALTKYYCV